MSETTDWKKLAIRDSNSYITRIEILEAQIQDLVEQVRFLRRELILRSEPSTTANPSV